VQVCVAVIFCLLAAGVVFGYAAIKPVLIQEGVYRDQCAPGEDLKDAECNGQEIRYVMLLCEHMCGCYEADELES
jgi:hypothetical protein